MKNVFDYARDKIHKEYRNRNDYNDENIRYLEEYKINDISKYEKLSYKSLKNAVSFRIKAFCTAMTDEEKSLLTGVTMVCVFLILLFLHGIKDTPMNILILNNLECVYYGFIFMFIRFLYRLIRNNMIRSGIFYAIWIFSFILSIPYIPTLFGYETTQIGDLYEAREYTANYYVIMSREPETAKDRKIYTRPAEITRQIDYKYTTAMRTDSYTQQEYGGDDIYGFAYHIKCMYFLNGTRLDFSTDDNNSVIYLNKETKVTSTSGKDYYITLTGKKCDEVL